MPSPTIVGGRVSRGAVVTDPLRGAGSGEGKLSCVAAGLPFARRWTRQPLDAGSAL